MLTGMDTGSPSSTGITVSSSSSTGNTGSCVTIVVDFDSYDTH